VADDAELVRAPLDLLAVRAVPDHAQARVDAALPQPPHREQHVVRPLHARHPPDPADREAAGRDAE
jgi:hypothetical protein